ncbi:MAG TPA: EamA/RhaT family transporter [Clostridiaceae bacterium]|nr:EamA/RhaT family transporter [Clostridiaceae bacterium]
MAGKYLQGVYISQKLNLTPFIFKNSHGQKAKNRYNGLYEVNEEEFMKSIDVTKNIFQRKAFVILFAVLASILWGSAFPVLKITYEQMNMAGDDLYGKILIAGIRFFLAGVLLLLYAFITMGAKIKLKRKKDVYRVFSLGLVQTSLNYFFFYIGLANTTASKGAIISSLSNFLIIILAHFIYSNDKLNGKKLYGIVFGIIGVVVVNLDGGVDASFKLMGEGFMFFSVGTAILSSFMVKSYAKNIHPMLLSAYQLIFGGFVMLLISLGGSYETLRVTPLSIGLLVYSAILSAVAFTLWYTLLKYNKPGEITMFRFLIPVSGSILSAIFLGETITIQVAISLFSIVIGIILVNREPKRKALQA